MNKLPKIHRKGPAAPPQLLHSESRGCCNFISIIKDSLVGSASEASVVGLHKVWLVLDPVGRAAPDSSAPNAPPLGRAGPRQQPRSPSRDGGQGPDSGLPPRNAITRPKCPAHTGHPEGWREGGSCASPHLRWHPSGKCVELVNIFLATVPECSRGS